MEPEPKFKGLVPTQKIPWKKTFLKLFNLILFFSFAISDKSRLNKITMQFLGLVLINWEKKNYNCYFYSLHM